MIAIATLQEDISEYLVGLGLVEGYGLDCFGDFIPEEPNKAIILYEYNGDPINPFTDVVHRSMQIMVRDNTAEDARVLSLKIHSALRKPNLCVNFTDTRFAQVHIRQAPFKLKTDENNRVIYCFNIGITTTID